MRIAIDGSLAAEGRTGMGVMVVKTLLALADRHPDDEYHLFLRRGANLDVATEMQRRGISVRFLPDLPYPVFEHVAIPLAARRMEADAIWYPYNTGAIFSSIPITVTVHDLIYMQGRWTDQASARKRLGKLYRRLVVPHAIAKAAVVTTVSEASRAEIDSRYPEHSEKLVEIGRASCRERVF